MFQQLTQYLFQFHRISLPYVGTIELVAQPARLDIANKLMLPPTYQVDYRADYQVTEHQVDYFAVQLQGGKPAAEKFIREIGAELNNKIKNAPFAWKGVGTFEFVNGAIQFSPETITTTLQPVRAERVLRENVQHSVLVGDQVVFSDGKEKETKGKTKDSIKLVLWVLAVLAIAFIAYYLYQHGFSAVGSSGLQQKIQPAAGEPTYK